MDPVSRFIQRSRKSGSSGAGIIADAFCLGLGKVCSGLKMNDYFLRKGLQHSRMGWTKYASDGMSEKLRLLNPPETADVFSDKAHFDAKYRALLCREWILPAQATEEEFGAFLQRHPDAIAKPRTGKGGAEVEKLHLPADGKELSDIYARMIAEDKLVEERIIQHDEVSGFNPHAVNTVRITTFYTEDGPVILAPLMRIGCGGSVSDNFDAGGVLVMLDPDTGAMLSGAMNHQYKWFDEHPETGKHFEGFRVPHWEAARNLAIEAAKLSPDAPYVGWDVAITPEGAVLVEGNIRPSLNWQCIDKRGWRKELMAAYKSAKRRMEQRSRA